MKFDKKEIRVHSNCPEDIIDWGQVSKHGTVTKGAIEHLSLSILSVLNETEKLLASEEAIRAHRVAKNHFVKALSILYPLGNWIAAAEEDRFCMHAFDTPHGFTKK